MKKKILVIDDEEPVRKLMRRILLKAEYEVMLSSDGEDGIQKLKSFAPDLIMVDMNMPKMNGLDFLRYVRDKNITEVPVLMVSGSSDPEQRSESYKLGVYDFISKPEQIEVMLKRIENGIKICDMINFTKFIKIELAMAKKLQKYLFPEPEKKSEKINIYTYTLPLSDIGGDLYDYIFFQDGRMIFFVADVTGHSISAALFTAIVKMVFRNALKISDDPGALLTIMNRELSGNLPIETFVTIFCGMVDPAAKKLYYANAGHPNPYFLTNGAGDLLEGHNTFLGPIENLTFETFSRTVKSGEAVLIYTDGVQDIMDRSGQKIGKTMISNIMGNSGFSPVRKFEALREDIQNPDAVMMDDCTLMLVDIL